MGEPVPGSPERQQARSTEPPAIPFLELRAAGATRGNAWVRLFERLLVGKLIRAGLRAAQPLSEGGGGLGRDARRQPVIPVCVDGDMRIDTEPIGDKPPRRV